jgi:hypothetical protein
MSGATDSPRYNEIGHEYSRIGQDIESEAWDQRHGELRHGEAHDVGLRLIVNVPQPSGLAHGRR